MPGTSPGTISKIQEMLQRIQKSPQGWQLAQALLDKPVQSPTDDQIKFFGALTIIVKLNTERSVILPILKCSR